MLAWSGGRVIVAVAYCATCVKEVLFDAWNAVGSDRTYIHAQLYVHRIWREAGGGREMLA